MTTKQRDFEELKARADSTDQQKGEHDLTFWEAKLIHDEQAKSGDVWETIRIAYNLGFSKGMEHQRQKEG